MAPVTESELPTEPVVEPVSKKAKDNKAEAQVAEEKVKKPRKAKATA